MFIGILKFPDGDIQADVNHMRRYFKLETGGKHQGVRIRSNISSLDFH